MRIKIGERIIIAIELTRRSNALFTGGIFLGINGNDTQSFYQINNWK